MKIHNLNLFISIILNSIILGNCNVTIQSQLMPNKTIIIANALLHTTFDTVSLIYPKEMGYKSDLKQKIFKIKNDFFWKKYRIEDAVYDDQTYSIYVLISNSFFGAEIIRLTDLKNLNKKLLFEGKQADISKKTTYFEYELKIAANWSKTLVFKNYFDKIISLDINVKKQKLYWIELNSNFKWSFVIKRLNNLSLKPEYFSFRNLKFSMDIYSFVIAHDNDYFMKSKQNNKKNDILFFVSNFNRLDICFLENKTCRDYFKSSNNKLENQNFDYKEIDYFKIGPIREKPYLNKFGKLAGINYDIHEHALYVSDTLNGRIEKLFFDKDHLKLNEYKLLKKSNIFESNYEQATIKSLNQAVYKNYLFWIDKGIKVSSVNKLCARTIYKNYQSKSLRSIQISLY